MIAFVKQKSYLPGVDQLDSEGQSTLERVSVVPQWGWPSPERRMVINPVEGIAQGHFRGSISCIHALLTLLY